MRAFVTEINSQAKSIELTIYNSANRKQFTSRIPKYFISENSKFGIGDEVVIEITKKEKKGKK